MAARQKDTRAQQTQRLVAERARQSLRAPVEPAETRWAQCRALGHSWQHRGSVPAGTGVRAFRSQCTFCGTLRSKYVSRSGSLGGMSYEWPDGYRQTGDDKLTTVEWRRTFVVQVFEDDDG